MDKRDQRPAGSGEAITRSSKLKRVMFRRTVFLMVVCGVLFFVPLFWKLWDIAIVHHEDYQQKATSQQTMDLSVFDLYTEIVDGVDTAEMLVDILHFEDGDSLVNILAHLLILLPFCSLCLLFTLAEILKPCNGPLQ